MRRMRDFILKRDCISMRCSLAGLRRGEIVTDRCSKKKIMRISENVERLWCKHEDDTDNIAMIASVVIIVHLGVIY